MKQAERIAEIKADLRKIHPLLTMDTGTLTVNFGKVELYKAEHAHALGAFCSGLVNGHEITNVIAKVSP